MAVIHVDFLSKQIKQNYEKSAYMDAHDFWAAEMDRVIQMRHDVLYAMEIQGAEKKLHGELAKNLQKIAINFYDITQLFKEKANLLI